jgi:signal transduction histidine kinase
MSVQRVVEHAVNEIGRRFADLRVVYGTIDVLGQLTVMASAQPEGGTDLTGLSVDLTTVPDYLRDLRTYQSVIVPDVLADARLTPLASAMVAGGTRAILYVPLPHADTPVGLLCFHSACPRQWCEHEIETLKDVAELLTVVVANAHAEQQRRQAEQALARSEARSQALLNAIPDLVCRLNRVGAIVDYKAEHAADDAHPAPAHGTTIREILPDVAPEVTRAVERALRTGETQVLEYQLLVGGSIRDREARIVGAGADEVVMIVRDVTEQRAAERMKDFFVSMVSHELRTPLTAVHGALRLLSGGALREFPEKQQQMLDIATANTERLIRLTNEILEAQRIRLGRFEIVKGACDVSALMTQALETVRPQAAKARVALVCTPHTARLNADGDRMVQVLTNLLSNAIRFSPAGATVRLSATGQGAQVVFQVRDQGPGIPVYDLQSIFEAFRQVEAPDMRWKGGIGLGLFICRSIVEAHGGRIWAESAPGHGSTFSVALPLGNGAASAGATAAGPP